METIKTAAGNNEIRAEQRGRDIEYRTQWRDEVDFLADRQIYYTIRKSDENGIIIYKYTKTAELFLALADFYLHRFPNRRSMATFKGFDKSRAEQQTFLNSDGTIKKAYDVKSKEEKQKTDQNVLNLDKIKEAQQLLKQAEDQVGKEKLALLTAEDDTE